MHYKRNDDAYHIPIPLFQTPQEIDSKRGRIKKSRFPYLQALVTEFQDSPDPKAKLQVLAQLGNFAYDPVNYEWFRKLHVIDLFLDALTEDDEKMIEFGIGGLCNLCIDPLNATIIVDNPEGISSIIQCLSSSREETVLSAISVLYYLLDIIPKTRHVILVDPVIQCMKKYSKSKNTKLCNLATIFLQDMSKYSSAPSEVPESKREKDESIQISEAKKEEKESPQQQQQQEQEQYPVYDYNYEYSYYDPNYYYQYYYNYNQVQQHDGQQLGYYDITNPVDKNRKRYPATEPQQTNKRNRDR